MNFSLSANMAGFCSDSHILSSKINYVLESIILIVQTPYSLNGFWSATGAWMSFLYFIKYANPYCHKGLHPPCLLIHLFMHFITQ